MLRTSFGQDELAGRGPGPRQEPNPPPRGVLQCIYNGEDVGVPQSPPCPLSAPNLGTPGSPEPWAGAEASLPRWDARAGFLDAPGLQTWHSLRKGKLRQPEMLWMHHCASQGRSSFECLGWGSSTRCQLMAAGG